MGSKKPPPLRLENDEVAGWGVDLLLDIFVKPAKASFWGLFGDVIFPKLNPANASLSPPLVEFLDWCPTFEVCNEGDCIPPNPPKDPEEECECC